jgi:hypothetical protein
MAEAFYHKIFHDPLDGFEPCMPASNNNSCACKVHEIKAKNAKFHDIASQYVVARSNFILKLTESFDKLLNE